MPCMVILGSHVLILILFVLILCKCNFQFLGTNKVVVVVVVMPIIRHKTLSISTFKPIKFAQCLAYK